MPVMAFGLCLEATAVQVVVVRSPADWALDLHGPHATAYLVGWPAALGHAGVSRPRRQPAGPLAYRVRHASRAEADGAGRNVLGLGASHTNGRQRLGERAGP